MEGWKEGGGWEFALVTDEQLEVFVACAESMTTAVRDGVQVPETSGTLETLLFTFTWEPRGLIDFNLQVKRHAPAPLHTEGPDHPSTCKSSLPFADVALAGSNVHL